MEPWVGIGNMDISFYGNVLSTLRVLLISLLRPWKSPALAQGWLFTIVPQIEIDFGQSLWSGRFLLLEHMFKTPRACPCLELWVWFYSLRLESWIKRKVRLSPPHGLFSGTASPEEQGSRVCCEPGARQAGWDPPWVSGYPLLWGKGRRKHRGKAGRGITLLWHMLPFSIQEENLYLLDKPACEHFFP